MRMNVFFKKSFQYNKAEWDDEISTYFTFTRILEYISYNTLYSLYAKGKYLFLWNFKSWPHYLLCIAFCGNQYWRNVDLSHNLYGYKHPSVMGSVTIGSLNPSVIQSTFC